MSDVVPRTRLILNGPWIPTPLPDDGPEAVVAYIEREDGKVCVVWNKRYGKWGFPGGKVEESDGTNRASRIPYALARELDEEVGITRFRFSHIASGPHGEKVEATRGSIVHVYSVQILEGQIPHEREEGCAVTWMTRAEFLKWGIASPFYEKLFAALDRLHAERVAEDGAREVAR